jgi:hypothetical protein
VFGGRLDEWLRGTKEIPTLIAVFVKMLYIKGLLRSIEMLAEFFVAQSVTVFLVEKKHLV